jgi:hypothetical protein
MYELKVRNNSGEVLNLSTTDKYTVYKITGLNPVKTNISSSMNATTDGITINRTSLGSRNIVIYMTINGDVEANRIDLYNHFPQKENIDVYFKNDTRDVHIEGTVESIECDLFSQKQIAQISIICPQPYFKAVGDLVTYFSEVASLFSFPFSISKNGMEFSVVTTDIRKTIVNNGEAESGIVIKMYANGSVVNPTIHDVRKRTHIRLNYTLQANDEVVIDTNTGKKTITLIRQGVSYNILGHKTPDSKWLTVAKGDNVFTFSSESGNSNLQVEFKSSTLYGGV